MTFIKPEPTPALAALYAEDEARGVQPLTFHPAPAPPAVGPGPSIRELMELDPPNWEAEAAERARVEADRRARELAQVVEHELGKLESEQPPAKRRRWRG